MRIRYFKGYFGIGFAILVMFSLAVADQAVATEGELSLPLTPVSIEVSDGTGSHFIVELSNVPSGYDVVNGTYLGWCVDVRAEMARSPATHAVMLYSSGNPPGELVNEKWDLVNYILNHKQGSAEDIQQAIWYFVHMDGNYTPTSAVAWTIIDDALANGDGFVPEFGQVIAVISYPVVMFPGQEDVQISVIEVTNIVIPEFPSIIILPVLMVLTLLVVAVYRKYGVLVERTNLENSR